MCKTELTAKRAKTNLVPAPIVDMGGIVIRHKVILPVKDKKVVWMLLGIGKHIYIAHGQAEDSADGAVVNLPVGFKLAGYHSGKWWRVQEGG